MFWRAIGKSKTGELPRILKNRAVGLENPQVRLSGLTAVGSQVRKPVTGQCRRRGQ
jgi:hypothetical protein